MLPEIGAFLMNFKRTHGLIMNDELKNDELKNDEGDLTLGKQCLAWLVLLTRLNSLFLTSCKSALNGLKSAYGFL
jgi:hypothetical protein